VAPRSWLHLPRRTVRLRLTALYGGLFLISGAVLLAITYGLVVGRPEVTSFRVQSASGGIVKVVAGQVSGAVPACLVPGAPASQCPPGLVLPSGAVGGQYVKAGAAPSPSTIRAIFATLPTPSEQHNLFVVSIIALGIMTCISIGLGWVMAGRVLRPLRSMTATAREISELNLNWRLAVRGPDDELKDLGDTIDSLLGRLETAFEAQRRFVANASHELRTPLAMMRTSVDVAVGKPHAPAEVKVLGDKLEEGLNQADKLLEGLLLLARAQRGALGEITDVPLGDLVAAALAAEQDEISRKHLDVHDETGPGEVRGNETLLTSLVANVISNAVCHNVDGGTITITSGAHDDKAFLVVENGGPVLAGEAVRALAQPFQRLGPDRVADNNGAGLGLSIVRAIATAHGGALYLRARPEGGLHVSVELPAAQRPGVRP